MWLKLLVIPGIQGIRDRSRKLIIGQYILLAVVLKSMWSGEVVTPTIYVYIYINYKKTYYIPTHFHSIRSDDPPPPSPLVVENAKIRENSEKNLGMSQKATKKSA